MTIPDSSFEVLAAGGVVTRQGKKRVKALLVHRPAYDDWTFPKGKIDSGESMAECAIREVLEETGFGCELLDELPHTMYRDAKGREKLVRYWQMRVVSGSFVENDEVDEIRWVALEKLDKWLTYEHDRIVALPLLQA